MPWQPRQLQLRVGVGWCSRVNSGSHFAELFVSMMTMAQRTRTLRSLKKVLKIMDLICQMRYGLQYHITLDAKSNSADTVKKIQVKMFFRK